MPKSTLRDLVALAVLVAAPFPGLAQTSAVTAPIGYKAGQVWSVAAGDELVTILKIEDLPTLGRVIHVRITNIPVVLCPGLRLTTSIAHVAINEKMMRKSTENLVRENDELPDSYFDGYRLWQAEKKPKVVKDETVSDVIRKMPSEYPVICNFVPVDAS